MKTIMKCALFLTILISFANKAVASPDQLFDSCRNINTTMNKEMVPLNSRSNIQRIYIIKNRSDYPVMVDLASKYRTGAKAGWLSKIEPGYWSSLTVSRKEFGIECFDNRHGDSKVDCGDYLRVCRLSQKAISNSNWKGEGGYWLAENVAYDELLSRFKTLGFQIQH